MAAADVMMYPLFLGTLLNSEPPAQDARGAVRSYDEMIQYLVDIQILKQDEEEVVPDIYGAAWVLAACGVHALAAAEPRARGRYEAMLVKISQLAEAAAGVILPRAAPQILAPSEYRYADAVYATLKRAARRPEARDGRFYALADLERLLCTELELSGFEFGVMALLLEDFPTLAGMAVGDEDDDDAAL